MENLVTLQSRLSQTVFCGEMIWCTHFPAPVFVHKSVSGHFQVPFKRLFGTLVRKLLLSTGLTLSSNNNSAPQALILVFRD
jgi:hypothetical protein